MHSRIYKLYDVDTPVEDILTSSEDEVYECFSHMADYVSEIKDAEEFQQDLCWLIGEKNISKHPEKAEYSIIQFAENYKEEFFNKTKNNIVKVFNEMIEPAIKKLQSNNEKLTDEFIRKECCNLDSAVYSLKEAVNDGFGFYVLYNEEYYTLDEFVNRYCLKLHQAEQFVVSQIFDYHF